MSPTTNGCCVFRTQPAGCPSAGASRPASVSVGTRVSRTCKRTTSRTGSWRVRARKSKSTTEWRRWARSWKSAGRSRCWAMASLTSSKASSWRRECSSGAASAASGGEMTWSAIGSRIAPGQEKAQPKGGQLRSFAVDTDRVPRHAVELFRSNRLLVFGEVDGLPFAALDAFANLGGGPALVGLFIGVESFADARSAGGAVLAGEAIEQAAMTLAAVAVAIAGLLIESFLDARGQGIGVSDDGIGEEVGAHG